MTAMKTKPNILLVLADQLRTLSISPHERQVLPCRRMLYDLQTDPGQLDNLCDDPDYAGVRDRLAVRLRELLDERGDDLHPCGYYRDWIDHERRIVRNAFGPLPHPDTEPDWSLLKR